MTRVYVIGSLGSKRIPIVAAELRQRGCEVFDNWHAAGPDADRHWEAYERARGHDYIAALNGVTARHNFALDRQWLDWCDVAVLVMPAGKSGHLELGYCIGRGKPGHILLDGELERWDLMHRFATGIWRTVDELACALNHGGRNVIL